MRASSKTVLIAKQYIPIRLSWIVISLALFAIFWLAPLSANSSAVSNTDIKYKNRGTNDILKIISSEAPTMLNPHLTLAGKDFEALRITYEPLASADKNGDLVPFLAAEIPSLENGGLAGNGKSVTWKLKKNVKWSDGLPFTADDVLFTFQFITNPQVKASDDYTYADVKNVRIIDPYTVKVCFKHINPAWAVPFTGIQGCIIPRHIFEPYNGPNSRKARANTLPVGTGPYRVLSPGIKPQEVLFLGTQLMQTNKIVFEPNPYYRRLDKTVFHRIEFRGGFTTKEAARSVLNGEADYTYGLDQLGPAMLVKIQNGEHCGLVINFGPNGRRILLNRTDPRRETGDGERSSIKFQHPFFSDKRVRQAFAHAVDRVAVAKLFGPAGRPTTNNLISPPKYNSPNTRYYEFKAEKAKALLNEAGWTDSDGDGVLDKNGVKMKVVFQTSVGDALQKIQQIIKNQLELLGIEVVLKMVDPGVMFSAGSANPDSMLRFNADLQSFAIFSDYPDPVAFMKFWTCGQIPQKANNWSGLNIERWCNPEYEALHELSTRELDPEKRRQLFIRMNDMQIEDVVMIPTVHMANVLGVSRTIQGMVYTPWDAITWNIMDWRRKPRISRKLFPITYVP